MLQCCYCSKEFKYESEKKRHEQSHIPQFECQECSKKFSFLSALRRHQKQHERTGSVKCTDCGHNFRDETLLKRHIKYAHKGTYICSKCNAKFNSDLALSSHMKSHKPKSERRFQCSFKDCNKSFNFQHHLKHHELTHTNAKQHYCKTCGKGFIQLHYLKSHMRTHEPEKWLCCTVSDCNKKFVTEYARKRHLVTHRITIDSGISSDSNCDPAQELAKDETVFCATCGQMIKESLYPQHELECTSETPDDWCIQLKSEIEPNNNFNIETFSNCKTVLGKCIANENSPNSCLCAQIKEATNFYDDLLSIENFNPVKDQADKKSCDDNLSSNKKCEGCDCMNRDSTAQSSNVAKEPLVKNASNDNVPKLEYRDDGVIKLEETWDISIDIKKDDRIKENHDIFNINSFVPYNSCKAVLGKCIVTGSGTISEHCLCAKMAIEEHQMTAEEIDEITPRPTISI